MKLTRAPEFETSAVGSRWTARHFYAVPLPGGELPLISSVRVETNGSPHARITVWSRHALIGTLTVPLEDAEYIALRLLATVPVADGGA